MTNFVFIAYKSNLCLPTVDTRKGYITDVVEDRYLAVEILGIDNSSRLACIPFHLAAIQVVRCVP